MASKSSLFQSLEDLIAACEEEFGSDDPQWRDEEQVMEPDSAITFGAIRRAKADYNELVVAVRRIYMWVSPAALAEDPDTASVEARRICREILGMPQEADWSEVEGLASDGTPL